MSRTYYSRNLWRFEESKLMINWTWIFEKLLDKLLQIDRELLHRIQLDAEIMRS